MLFIFRPKPDPLIRRKLAADLYLLAHAENFWTDYEGVRRETAGQPEAAARRQAFLRERVPAFEKAHGIRPPDRRDVVLARQKIPSDLTRVASPATPAAVRAQITTTRLPVTDRQGLRTLLAGRGPVRVSPNTVSLLTLSLWEARQEAEDHRRAIEDPIRRWRRRHGWGTRDPRVLALADPRPPQKPRLDVLRGVVHLPLSDADLAAVLRFLDFPGVSPDPLRALRQVQNLRRAHQ